MKRRPVKITGIGPVTPAGIGQEAFWKGICEPTSRVRPFKELDNALGAFAAACVDGFDISRYLERALVPKGAARHTQLAIAGAILALKDAGIDVDSLKRRRVAIVTGSCIMDVGSIIDSAVRVQTRGPRGARARTIHTTGIGSVPSAINACLGLSARVVALSNQCSSGLDAIGHAASYVASGEIDIAICGGADSPLQQFPLVELRAAELTYSTNEMAARQVRPFDRWRNASAIAEGCSMFIIEPDQTEAKGYCYVSGYGFSSDVSSLKCSGLEDAARIALAHGALAPHEVDVIHAWGPGDWYVDRGEAQAMQRLFASRLPEVAAVSIKGAIGSALGAAPAIQVAAAALGQRYGVVPPTVNWEFPDPECPLNLSNQPRQLSHRVTLVNAHGLGAVNGALVLERC